MAISVSKPMPVFGQLVQSSYSNKKASTARSPFTQNIKHNYEVHDCEMLAIIQELSEWRHYLIGREFDIWSDHKNLSWFMTKQNLNRRQARWAAELAKFDFLLHYKKGSTMGQSDALSRRPDLKGEVEHDNTDQVILPTHRFADLRALSTGVLIHSEGDAVVNKIQRSQCEYDQKVITALEEVARSTNKRARDMATWGREDGLVTQNGLVVVPRD
jgi:hypothetical protein